MSALRLIADDLTGALDSGCAFASPAEPVNVGLPGRPLPAGRRVAMSTETRDMSEQDAVRAAIDAVRAMRTCEPDTLWFKKIDSVMRGHPFAETKATFEAGRFSRCVFAPAYPAMGRITVNATQYVAGKSVGPPFRDAFSQVGLSVGAALSFIDADSQEVLRERVEHIPDPLNRTLWVGAGGLAAALAPVRSMISFPPVRGIVVGTSHPSTKHQVESALSTGNVHSHTPAGQSKDSDRVWLLSPGISSANADETTSILHRDVPLIEMSAPDVTSIIVTGGETLATVLDIVGADFLECMGEATTGVPVARVKGGRWNGVTLLSKSGGFGDAGLFARLIARSR